MTELFGDDITAIANNPFLQYGSFGLNVLLLIWFMWKGAPLALEKHKEAVKSVTDNALATITKLVDEFKNQQKECREERLLTAEKAEEEREKDRSARHEMANVLMKVEHAIETLSDKIG